MPAEPAARDGKEPPLQKAKVMQPEAAPVGPLVGQGRYTAMEKLTRAQRRAREITLRKMFERSTFASQPPDELRFLGEWLSDAESYRAWSDFQHWDDDRVKVTPTTFADRLRAR